MNNLVDQPPQLVRELASAYEVWAERVGVEPWKAVLEQRRDGSGRLPADEGTRVEVEQPLNRPKPP